MGAPLNPLTDSVFFVFARFFVVVFYTYLGRKGRSKKVPLVNEPTRTDRTRSKRQDQSLKTPRTFGVLYGKRVPGTCAVALKSLSFSIGPTLGVKYDSLDVGPPRQSDICAKRSTGMPWSTCGTGSFEKTTEKECRFFLRKRLTVTDLFTALVVGRNTFSPLASALGSQTQN